MIAHDVTASVQVLIGAQLRTSRRVPISVGAERRPWGVCDWNQGRRSISSAPCTAVSCLCHVLHGLFPHSQGWHACAAARWHPLSEQ